MAIKEEVDKMYLVELVQWICARYHNHAPNTYKVELEIHPSVLSSINMLF